MVKKGKLEEIFSKARFYDNPSSYRIVYRDLDVLKEITLPEFLEESNNFQTIPITRIELVKKNNKIIFRSLSKKNNVKFP